MRRVLVAAVLAGICASTLVPASAATTKSEDYVAGFAGDSDGLCAEDPLNPTGLNVGVVCIATTGSRVRITITDATTIPVAGYYVFLTAGGDPQGGAVSFCGVSNNAVIPSGTKTVVVYIGGPALGPLACMVDHEEGWPGVGTVGSVAAAFS